MTAEHRATNGSPHDAALDFASPGAANGTPRPQHPGDGRISLAPADQPDVMEPPADFREQLTADFAAVGGEQAPNPDAEGSIGRTLFDVPSSEDNTVTVVMHANKIAQAPAQALLRIKSPDERSYLGIVSAGPFAEPNNMRGDSPLLVTVVTSASGRDDVFLPPYHGRVQVSILGEELADETLVPPRWRPLPNSFVYALDEEEAARVLRSHGDIRLGLVAGHTSVEVRVPSDAKSVLPRHLAILGTTGGGKSTTVSRLVQQARTAGMAVILLDVEGEYTHLHEPTEDARMLAALADRGLEPAGIPADRMRLYHLVGRETANPKHPHREAFSLQFARLSPYAVAEILGLTEAQHDRFMKAYELGKALLRTLNIFPSDGPGRAEEERLAIEVDELERGYPRLTLSFLIDVVTACLQHTDGAATPAEPYNAPLKTDAGKQQLKTLLGGANLPKSPASWRALLGRLSRLRRLKVFDIDTQAVRALRYKRLLEPGRVSVVDLSDTSMSELSNIVIADLMRGVQEAQDEAYVAYERACAQATASSDGAAPVPPPRVLIIVEEAHEFLSAERIDKMPILFQQVARIAKRGRKRWLSLVFVTQLPQHLPPQVLGLMNSYILHKITDPRVVSTLQRTVAGVDDGLWKRLPGLAPGQAIVSFPHMTRPLLAAIDPAPTKLRLID